MDSDDKLVLDGIKLASILGKKKDATMDDWYDILDTRKTLLHRYLVAYDHPTLKKVLVERYGQINADKIVGKSEGCLECKGLFGEMRSGSCRGCVPAGSSYWWGLVEKGWLLIMIDFVDGKYEITVNNVDIRKIKGHPFVIWQEISKKIEHRVEEMAGLYSGLQAIHHTIKIEDGLLFADGS
ncbi:MAG: hypothetical protein WCX69_04040 [Candidatus Paceibacterota bacterium]